MIDREGIKRKCPKCRGELLRVLPKALQSDDASRPQVRRTLRFKCQVCSLESTAAELHGDFWGHVHALINEAEKECSRMVKGGQLGEFEKAWLDPKNGTIAKLSEHPWFADAKPAVRKIAAKSIRDYVKSNVNYYHYCEKLWEADFG